MSADIFVETPAAGAHRRVLLAALAVAGAMLAAWGWVLALPLMTGADVWPILAQGRSALTDPSILWRQRYLEGLWDGARFWRPLLVAFSGVEWALFGESAFGYHAVRLALAGLVAALLGRLAAAHGRRPEVAFAIAALVFAWHPLRVETLPAIARDSDTLFNLAMVLAVWWLSGAREARRSAALTAGLAAALAAPLIKEPGLLAPVVGLVVLEPWRRCEPGARRALAGAAILVLGLAAHLSARLALLGTIGGYQQTWVDLTRGEALRAALLALVDHQAHGLWPWALGLTGLALVSAGAARPVSPRPLPAAVRARRRRIGLGLAVWIAGIGSAIVTASRFRSRYVEALLAPLAVVAAALIAAALDRALARPRDLLLLGVPTGAGLALALVVLPGTPLLWSYPQWREAAVVGGRVVDRLEALVRAAEQAGGELQAARLGRFALSARAIEDGGVVVGISPFPYKIAEPEGPRTGSISTVVIMGQQTLEGFWRIRGLPLPLVVRRGPPALDVRPSDLEPTADSALGDQPLEEPADR